MADLAYPVVRIPGLSGEYVEISERYDYKADPCRCPACEGLGTPWGGWFSCEECTAKALVGDGRCFLLLRPAANVPPESMKEEI